MTLLSLREASVYTCALTTEQARWLQDLGVGTCSPSRAPGCFDVRVANVAGLVAQDDLTVEITPKLPVGELMWLLTYAATGVTLTPDEVSAAPTTAAEALATVLLRFVGKVVARGIPRGYWNRDETSPTLRGRLRLTDQVSRHLGRLHPLELSYDEFGVDVPENRLMRAACVKALDTLAVGDRDGQAALQAEARRLVRAFDGVTQLAQGARPPQWTRTPQNAHAWAAIELSELVLRDCGIDSSHGSHTSSGLVIKVWRVFEAAVARGLQEARPEWRVSAQRSYPLVGSKAALTMRPDLVIETREGVLAVADTKYKNALPTSDDLYQLFTYARYLGLQRSHLIYADPLAEPRTMPVGRTGVDVLAHGLDLAHPSRNLRHQLSELAASLPASHESERPNKHCVN